MIVTRELISDIVTGLEHTRTYEAHADEGNWAKGDEDFQKAVDIVAELMKMPEFGKLGNYVLTAAAEHIKGQPSNTRFHELEGYLQEHYRGSGYDVAETLKDHAASLDGTGHALGNLYDQLDQAGGVDYFDWGAYADSGSSYLSGLKFILLPTTGAGTDRVFLFED